MMFMFQQYDLFGYVNISVMYLRQECIGLAEFH